MTIVRTKEEIDEVLNEVNEIKNSVGSKFHGMSYEEGLEAMHDWLTGETDENPLEA